MNPLGPLGHRGPRRRPPRPDLTRHLRGPRRFYSAPRPSRTTAVALAVLASLALYALTLASDSPSAPGSPAVPGSPAHEAGRAGTGDGPTEEFLRLLREHRPHHERVLRSGTARPGTPVTVDLSPAPADGNRLSFACRGGGSLALRTDQEGTPPRTLGCDGTVHSVKAGRPQQVVLTPGGGARVSWALTADAPTSTPGP